MYVINNTFALLIVLSSYLSSIYWYFTASNLLAYVIQIRNVHDK